MKTLKISAVFVDLFALLVCFIFAQWYLSVLLMNINDEVKPTATPRAEILVFDIWKDIEEDVDIWIHRVGHEKVGFSSREAGPFILHGDHTSSSYGVVDGKKLLEATEVISIVKKIPGRYQISLHGFRMQNPVDVSTSVQHVDPFRKICSVERSVGHGEEVPVCEFTIKPDGSVVDVITDLDILTTFLSGGTP